MRTSASRKLIFAVAALALGFAPTVAAGTIAYTAIALPTLGGQHSYGYGINSSGQVVGSSYLIDGTEHAFVYTPGIGMTDLGSLGGGYSAGYGINDSGQVTGDSRVDPGGFLHAFVYTPGVGMTDLGLFGPSAARGVGINNLGQVAVNAGSGYGDASAAFVYTPGVGATDVGNLLGTPWGSTLASGINAIGQVTGYSCLSYLCPDERAIIASPGGGMTDLGTLGGTTSCGGSAINALGQVTGDCGPSGPYAFLYSPGGTMTNLGALGGTPSSGAGINDLGQVVGGDASGAFLYSSGTMYDLNDLVTNGLASGAILTEAAAINNQGWIVASDGHSGTTYLLEPTESSVPEPTSTLLTLLGAIAVSISRIRFRRSRSHCGRETQVHPIDGLNI